MKGTSKKITTQKGGFLFFKKTLLMTAGLTLMKSVLTPLAKTVFVLLALTTATSETDVAIQKNAFGSGTIAIIISNCRYGRYRENS